MPKSLFVAAFAVLALTAPASAMNCGAVLDDITKAISGHLNLSGDEKASRMRLALSGYDSCMAGDTKSAGNIRDMLMTQLKQNLGNN
jgi:hypothetical protein